MLRLTLNHSLNVSLTVVILVHCTLLTVAVIFCADALFFKHSRYCMLHCLPVYVMMHVTLTCIIHILHTAADHTYSIRAELQWHKPSTAFSLSLDQRSQTCATGRAHSVRWCIQCHLHIKQRVVSVKESVCTHRAHGGVTEKLQTQLGFRHKAATVGEAVEAAGSDHRTFPHCQYWCWPSENTHTFTCWKRPHLLTFCCHTGSYTDLTVISLYENAARS